MSRDQTARDHTGRDHTGRDHTGRDHTEFSADNGHTGIQAVSFLVLLVLSAVVIWPLLARFGVTQNLQELIGPVLPDPAQAPLVAGLIQGAVLALLSLWVAFRLRWLALGTAAAILAIYLPLR